jgi:hypothetical protein
MGVGVGGWRGKGGRGGVKCMELQGHGGCATEGRA